MSPKPRDFGEYRYKVPKSATTTATSDIATTTLVHEFVKSVSIVAVAAVTANPHNVMGRDSRIVRRSSGP